MGILPISAKHLLPGLGGAHKVRLSLDSALS
jgi:hypothetical protein